MHAKNISVIVKIYCNKIYSINGQLISVTFFSLSNLMISKDRSFKKKEKSILMIFSHTSIYRMSAEKADKNVI